MTFTSLRSVLVLSAALVLGAGGLVMSQQSHRQGHAPGSGQPAAGAPVQNAAPVDPVLPVDPLRQTGVPSDSPNPFPEMSTTSRTRPGPGPGGFPGPAQGALSQRVLNVGKLVAALAPARDRISVYSEETGQWDVYQAPAGTTVVPIANSSLVVTAVKGERITQLAAVSSAGGKWRTQELRAPASGGVAPTLSISLATYTQGAHVYAYSAEADRWDVLDLGAGKTARPVVGPSTVIVEDGDKLSVFGAKTGRWETTDMGKP